VNQGHEDFPLGFFQLPYRYFDRRIAARVALFLKTLGDPFNGMTLFARKFPVRIKDTTTRDRSSPGMSSSS
jgi:hypothetical protein